MYEQDRYKCKLIDNVLHMCCTFMCTLSVHKSNLKNRRRKDNTILFCSILIYSYRIEYPFGCVLNFTDWS